jgi:glycosyltransferase involved in cell wall biosynthesis
MSPAVSVITPCYNQARFLPESVASVVAQTYPDWELIIVDDGSPDDTAAVAGALIAAYPHHTIRLLRQANAGLSASRNAAIRAAQGAYILPLDADDAIEPRMLERTVPVLDTEPEVGFVYTDVRLFGADDSLIRHEPYDLRTHLLNCQCHVSTLFRRRAWAQTAGFRSSMSNGYEDWDFWLSLAEFGWQGRHVAEPLFRYRRLPGSMLARKTPRDLEIRARIVLNHPRLYSSDFLAWAWQVQRDANGRSLAGRAWVRAYVGHCLLIARHAPHLLPKMMLRPLYWRLPERRQGQLRRIGRVLGMV